MAENPSMWLDMMGYAGIYQYPNISRHIQPYTAKSRDIQPYPGRSRQLSI
jgi:hypothetical protein